MYQIENSVELREGSLVIGGHAVNVIGYNDAFTGRASPSYIKSGRESRINAQLCEEGLVPRLSDVHLDMAEERRLELRLSPGLEPFSQYMLLDYSVNDYGVHVDRLQQRIPDKIPDELKDSMAVQVQVKVVDPSQKGIVILATNDVDLILRD